MSDGPGFSELLSSFGLDRDRNGMYDVCLTTIDEFGIVASYSRNRMKRRV